MSDVFNNCNLMSHLPNLFATLEKWQTLTAGVLALVAALGTMATIRCQMRQSDEIERKRILRQHNAVRMAFPFQLSLISTYLENVASVIISTFVWEEERGLVREDVKKAYLELFAPSWSDNIQHELSRLAETLVNVRHVKHLAELASNIQIINSQITNPSTNNDMTKTEALEIIICCGRSKILTENLYNYMRFVDHKFPTLLSDDKPEEAWKKILSRCHDFVKTGRNAVRFHALFKSTIDDKITAGSSPWLEKMNP